MADRTSGPQSRRKMMARKKLTPARPRSASGPTTPAPAPVLGSPYLTGEPAPAPESPSALAQPSHVIPGFLPAAPPPPGVSVGQGQRKYPYLSASRLTTPRQVGQRTYQPGDYLVVLRDTRIVYCTQATFDRVFNPAVVIPPAARKSGERFRDGAGI